MNNYKEIVEDKSALKDVFLDWKNNGEQDAANTICRIFWVKCIPISNRDALLLAREIAEKNGWPEAATTVGHYKIY
jgi:hypothetical protein